MENVRKRMEMELVSCDRRLQKLINKSTFKHCTTYSENLNAITLENKIINFCKPIYIGNFSINNIYIYKGIIEIFNVHRSRGS
jgi:excinuclease UvrABC nuclease subunit